MGNDNVTYLTDQGPTLIDNGFKIVPIKAGSKYPAGLKQWETIDATKKDVVKWSKKFEGVGVLARMTPGVDLDIRDQTIVDKMLDFITDLLGPTVQRVGMAPKTLLVFRATEPFTKVMSARYSDLMDNEHQVEILGDGQQFVAFAVHPDTRAPYQWVGDKDLTHVKAEDLPVITHEDAVKIVEYFEAIVPPYWEEIKPLSKGKEATPVDDFTILENMKPPTDISTVHLKKCLALIPSDDYHTWVRVGMALFHQFAGSVDGFDLWDQWSRKSDKYDARGIGFKWDSFESNLKREPVTAATILKLAKDFHKAQRKEVSQGFGLVHASDILSKLGPIPWLVKGVIEQDSTGLMFGDPANFKSFLSIDLACHVAAGATWHGHEVKQGPVIYVAGEGHNGFARRLAAWQLGNPEHRIEDLPIYFSLKAAGFYDEEEAQTVTNAIDQIVDQEGTKPVMIVIDTLARNFGAGDENSTSDMNIFVNHVNDFLRVKYGCVVMIVHHTGKADKNTARGSSALKGAVDFEYRVDRPDECGESLVCKLVNTKMKDAPQPPEIWFEGEEKTIGDFDEDITSLVFKRVAHPDQTPPGEKLKGQQQALYEYTKKQVEIDGYIDRTELRKLAIEYGICRDTPHFRKILFELVKKGLLEDKDKEISVLDSFF